MRVTWQRTKGDETHVDVLPPKISAFLLDYLGQLYDTWEDDPPSVDAAIWVSISYHHHGGPISSQAIADICAKRLKISKVHYRVQQAAHPAPLDALGCPPRRSYRLGHGWSGH